MKNKKLLQHITEQFFNQPHYFSEIWLYLGNDQRKKVLGIVSEGKGIIPYELIVGMNSYFLTPENVFLGKSRIF